MDNSFLSLLITLIIAFIFVSWFLTPESSTSNGSIARRRTRTVTAQMISTVQQIAPGLTTDQIRYDLERTGDVNVTIDNYLRDGDLPFPPNMAHLTTGAGISTGVNANMVSSDAKNIKSAVKFPVISSKTDESEGGPFGGLSFEEKRRELVLAARARISAKEGITWD